MNPEEAVKALIRMVGDDPAREGLLETPKRVVKAYKELLSGYEVNPKSLLKTFTNEGYEEMILVKNIDYFSMCEHHLLPFFGKAHIAYIPQEKITGLSKLPRLVEVFAKRLQNQERLTVQIAQTLMEVLQPLGVAVYLEGVHLCMGARGVQKVNSKTITTTFLGVFQKEGLLRNDFFQQIREHPS